MRRVALLTLVLLTLTALFWEPLLGAALKIAVRVGSEARLSFRGLTMQEGALVLDHVSLTVAGAPRLRAPRIALRCEQMWPLRCTVDLERPHLTLSQDVARELLSGSNSGRWSVAFTDGQLEWSDGTLPPSTCSLSHQLALRLAWGDAVLAVEQRGEHFHARWDPLPLAWLAHAFELVSGQAWITEAEGTLGGTAEFAGREIRALRVRGEKLAFRWNDIACKADVLLDAAHAPEHFRLVLDHGQFVAPSTEVRDVALVATFQEGLGVKWEGAATAMALGAVLPIESAGKGVLDAEIWEWLDGTFRLGAARGQLAEHQGVLRTFRWENLGSTEWALLRDFVGSEWELTTGQLSGQLSGERLDQLDALTASTLACKNARSTAAFGCERLTLADAHWTLDGGWGNLNGVLVSQCQGRWDIARHALELHSLGEIPWALSAQVDETRARVDGAVDGIRFVGAASWEDALQLQLTEVEGSVRPWFERLGLPLERGTVRGTLALRAAWDGALSLTDYTLDFQLREGATPIYHAVSLADVDLDLSMDPSGFEIHSARAILAGPTFRLPLSSPSMRLKPDSAFFDVRVDGEFGHLARLVGSRHGTHIEVDAQRSHVQGAPLLCTDLEMEGLRFTRGAIELALQEDAKSLEFVGRFAQNSSSYTLSVRGLSQPLDAHAEENQGKWTLSHLAYGPLRAACNVVVEAPLLQVQGGRASWGDGVSWEFEGSVTDFAKADLRLEHLIADLARLRPELSGQLTGSGQLSWSEEGIETDLDLVASQAIFKQIPLDNTGPLHVHISPERNVLVSGIDARVAEGHFQTELLELRLSEGRWHANGARATWPPFELDITASLSGLLDGTEASGLIQEGSVAYDTHLRNVHFFVDREHAFVEGVVTHRALTTNLFGQARLQPFPEGRLSLQEGEALPLVVEWSFPSAQGLQVHSVEGSCGGLEASFHALSVGQLVGSVRFDGQRAADWLPPDIARFFRELHIGQGCELKGHVSMTPTDWTDLQFKGLFSGKDVGLFGYEFKTLLAQASLSRSAVHLYDLQISDAAGRMNIPDLRMQANHPDPWTLRIPTISIQDFRPSFLHAPGKEAGSITPLVVRHLELRNLEGLLDFPKTYTAVGDVAFINSYKREETLLDLPSNVFGRILGLDLELLIPVSGEFSFTLKDGYFRLFDLKNAYSEAGRSEFLLMEPEGALPRMDLDGNLHILVQMKQFVLFKLTEAFAISIEGTIKDPQFSLTKKKSWLSFSSD